MGLFFGGKDDSKAKIEELKAKMQAGGAPQQWQQPQQPWQAPRQEYQPPQQTWQPPREQQHHPAPASPPSQPSQPPAQPPMTFDMVDDNSDMQGLILDLGDGMSLNLPVKSRMRLDEFLRIADRVRELKKIEHQQQY